MSFLIFFIAISLMIFVHELGHFWVAKWKGLKVEEFGFGFPPRIIGKKIGETIYSVNAIPMGGFVRIWGMEQKVEKEKKRAFYTQSKKVQFLILIAGVIMNFLLSIFVFAGVYGVEGIPTKMDKIKVLEVAEDSPAEKAGLKKDTFITEIIYDNKFIKFKGLGAFVRIVKEHAGEEIVLTTESGEAFNLVPRKNPPKNQGSLGIVITDTELTKPALYKRVPLGIWYGLREGFYWGREIVGGVFKMLKDLFAGHVPTDVAGPIGVYKASSNVLRRNGLLAAVHFFAIVSVNLAVVNILPLPGTDGWHISLLGFEKLRGRELSEKTKRKLNQAGMILILSLSVLLIIADIKRFVL